MVEAIAVEVVDLRLREARSWHRWEKLRDVLAQVEARPRLDVIAPWEFHVIAAPPSPAGYLSKSDLGPRAESWGIEADRVVVLRAWLEERAHDQLATLEGKRGVEAKARGYDSTVLVRLELLHPGTDRVLARYERSIVENRFLDVPEYDQRPQASALLRESLAAFLAAVVKAELVVESAPLPTGAPTVAESRSTVLDWRSGGPTLREHLQRLDPVLRKATLYARFRYFERDMSLLTFRARSKLPPGLILQAAAWPGSQPGDLVVCLGEQPIRHRFQWIRAWRRGRKGPGRALRPGVGPLSTSFSAGPRAPSSSPPCP